MNRSNDDPYSNNNDEEYDDQEQDEDGQDQDQEQDQEYEVEDDTEEKSQCPDCGRSFKPKAFLKHIKICKKVFMKKRKAFDSKKMRVVCNEQEELLRNQKKDKGKKNTASKPTKNSNWKAQSEMFRQAMRANAGDTGNNFEVLVKDPGSTNQFGGKDVQRQNTTTNTIKSIPSGLTHCSLCNRSYNDNAYTKHLPHCEKKSKENAMKQRKPLPGKK